MKRLVIPITLLALLLIKVEPINSEIRPSNEPYSSSSPDIDIIKGISLDHLVIWDPSCIAFQRDTIKINPFAGDRNSLTLWLMNKGPEPYKFYTALNCVLVTDNHNYAIMFDGLDDHLSVGRTPPLDIRQEITLEAWINLEKGHPGISPIISKGLDGFGYELYIEDSGTEKRLVFRIDPGCIQSNTTLKENQWYHVAATYDSDSIRIYINGIPEAVKSAHGSITVVNKELSVGTNSVRLDARSYFQGMMDEIRIWNLARTEMEIVSFRNRQLCGLETGLAGYWSFNENTVLALLDQTGNSKGTLAGGAGRIISSAPVMNMVHLPDSTETVPVDSTAEIGIELCTAGLQSSNYYFNIDIISTTPTIPDFSLPVRIHILDAPSIAILQDSVSFGEREIYTMHKFELEVKNDGTQTLIIDSVTTALFGSRITPSSATIDPGMQRIFLIEWYPREQKRFHSYLTFFTNDPSNKCVRIPLTGQGINTAGTVKIHDPIEETLRDGARRVKSLILTNCSPTEKIMIDGSVTSFTLPGQPGDRILKPDSISWVSITLPPGSVSICPGKSIQFDLVIDAENKGVGDYYAELTINCFAPLYYTKGIKPILMHIVPGTVDVIQVPENFMQIYPNPTFGELIIQTKHPGPWYVTITTINGQVIFERKMDGESGQLDLSDYPKGVYLITIRSKEAFQTSRIVKL
jgi:hypothetical protein